MKNLPIKKILFFLSFCFSYALYAQNKDSLWTVFNNKSVADTSRLNAIELLGWSFFNHPTDTGIKLFEKERVLAERYNLKKYQVHALNFMGAILCNKGNYNKALECSFLALNIARNSLDEIYIAECYSSIGAIYSAQNNYPKSLEYYFKDLEIIEKNDKLTGTSNARHFNIATIYRRLSNPAKALEFYLKDLVIYEKAGDKKYLAWYYGTLGDFYREQKKYKKALEYCFKALKFAKELNDEQRVDYCYDNIGIICLERSELKDALKFALLGKNDNTIAKVYEAQLNYSKAFYYYSEALQKEKAMDFKSGIGTAYINMAKILEILNDNKKAVQYLDSSLLLANSINDVELKKISYQNLSLIYSKLNNTKKAFDYYIKFKDASDTLFSRLNDQRVNEIQGKFDLEKKEAELSAGFNAQTILNNEAKKRQQYLIYFITVVLLIVIGFSVILFRRYKLTSRQKQIIEIKNKETEEQKHLIEEKHKEITDSINYAERIQRSFLATTQLLNENLKDYFVFFQPKDVVSGDFYWAGKLSNGNFAIVTADSTGHGVPGAIMSILNISCLEKAMEAERLYEPAEILNHTRINIIERLKKDGSPEGGKDGMDCSLVSFDFKNNKLIYAAANNPIWIVRENKMLEFSPDNMPVGKHDRDSISFTQHNIELQKGDMIYTLTDGFPDQFGGPRGKKFMYKKLKELLVLIAANSTEEQKKHLSTSLDNWKGTLEQVDDICIIGTRI